jgi:hypothetical protein
MKEEAEIIRIGYKYRKMLQSGKIRIPYHDAVKMIGPDCAYHLYNNDRDIPGKPNSDTAQ